ALPIPSAHLLARLCDSNPSAGIFRKRLSLVYPSISEYIFNAVANAGPCIARPLILNLYQCFGMVRPSKRVGAPTCAPASPGLSPGPWPKVLIAGSQSAGRITLVAAPSPTGSAHD